MQDAGKLDSLIDRSKEVDSSALDELPRSKKVLDFVCAAMERTIKVCSDNIGQIAFPERNDNPDGDIQGEGHGEETGLGQMIAASLHRKLQTLEVHAHQGIELENIRRAIVAGTLRDKRFVEFMLNEAAGEFEPISDTE